MILAGLPPETEIGHRCGLGSGPTKTRKVVSTGEA